MTVTKSMVNDLSWKILELQAQRKEQVSKKMNLQSKMKSLQKGPQKDLLKEEYAKTEQKIIELNQTIKRTNIMQNEAKRMSGHNPDDDVVDRLIKLVKKYRSFAKDKTRIASLRVMASEIADEIESIL